jgi:hypothetical protein
MIWRRRVLYTEERVRALFARMRDEMNERHLEHLRELAALSRELAEIRNAYQSLRSAVIEREKAEAGLALLHRDRDRRIRNFEGEPYWLH